MKGFIEFIRKQGVIGFAVGFILGGQVSQLVKALVDDIINPLLGLALGFAKNLDKASFKIASAEIKWGDFVNTFINFLVVALVVYLCFVLLKLDKLDKPKS